MNQVNLQPVVLLLIALLWASCANNDESITEKARRNADPQAITFLFNAQEAFEAGYYDLALAMADSAANYEPALADIPFLKGRVYTSLRRVEDALAAYEKVLELDPAYPGVYMNLGNSAFLSGQPEQALSFYRKEQARAEKENDDVVDSPAFLIQLGRAFADTGKPDSARWALEKAIQADSLNPTGYMWLGQVLEDEGEFEEALSYSRRGLDLQPANPNYGYVVGVQHLRNGDLQEAADLLEDVTGKLTTHYAAHYNLGQALLGLGKQEEAAYYLTRADTLLELQKEVEKWERLVNSNSHEPMLWVNYGTALHESGRIDDAIEALGIAFSLQPQWLEIQNNIANLLILKGDTTEAMARYQRLLQVDPNLPDIWFNLGTLHAMTGNYTEAREAWNKTLSLAPGHPEATAYLKQIPQ